MRKPIPCLAVVGLLGALLTGTNSARASEHAVADLREYLHRLERLGFAGTVVVARQDEVLLAEGFGLADRQRGIAWTPSTVSTIGSITKQFTGAAILGLAEEGLLSVDDPISKYFESLPQDKQGITLHHLLTHSSGIVDLDGAGDWDPIGRDEFVRRAMDQGLDFAPGERYEYSNAGYSLLGAIIEQLSGQSYEEYVRRRLFVPAGMFESGYILAPWGDGRLAQGYRGDETWGTVLGRPLADDGPFWVLRANGGIHSTAWDMLRWGRTLLAGEPLSTESMRAYWAPHQDEGGSDSFYGYGWVVMDVAGTRVITHNGGNGIFFADMAIVPDAGMVAVMQTNVVADFPPAGGLLETILSSLLIGEPLPRVPDRDVEFGGDLSPYAGRYALTKGGELEVTVDETGLAVEALDPSGFSTLLSTRAVDAARAERLSERIDAIVGAYLAGDWTPLWNAYGRPMPLESLAERGGERLRRLTESHGAPIGHRILGTAFRDGRDATLARIDCANGAVYRAYVWDPAEKERLLGVSGRGLDPVVHVLPEVGGSFATWDSRTGGSRPVRFEPTGDGGLRLVIGEPTGLEAVRSP